MSMPARPVEYHHLALACALARRFGLEVEIIWPPRKSWEHYAWDGSRLRAVPDDPSELIHDVAHWLCAPSHRRPLPEFGLGDSPGPWQAANLTVPYWVAGREERRASVVGILAERELGMPWEHTYNLHGWPVGRAGTGADFNRLARTVTARKMIEACRWLRGEYVVVNSRPRAT
jgi:hypothetical protein